MGLLNKKHRFTKEEIAQIPDTKYGRQLKELCKERITPEEEEQYRRNIANEIQSEECRKNIEEKMKKIKSGKAVIFDSDKHHYMYVTVQEAVDNHFIMYQSDTDPSEMYSLEDAKKNGYQPTDYVRCEVPKYRWWMKHLTGCRSKAPHILDSNLYELENISFKVEMLRWKPKNVPFEKDALMIENNLANRLIHEDGVESVEILTSCSHSDKYENEKTFAETKRIADIDKLLQKPHKSDKYMAKYLAENYGLYEDKDGYLRDIEKEDIPKYLADTYGLYEDAYGYLHDRDEEKEEKSVDTTDHSDLQ